MSTPPTIFDDPTLLVGPGPSNDLVLVSWQLGGRPLAWIQRTDDLLDWIDWREVTTDGSETDAIAARRFYRIRF